MDTTYGHNIYFQVLAMGGLVAGIGLAIVVWVVIVRPAMLARKSPISPEMAGLSGGMTGFLVAEIFQNILWERYMWIFAALIVLCYARERLQHSSHP